MRSLTRCALVTILAAACDREGDRGVSALGDTITIRRTREVDLTGDRRPERFLVVATGPRYDSLEVTLEIRSPEDSLLYMDSWDSGFYFRYVDRSQLSDSVVEQRVRAQIDSLLGNASFRPGGTELTTDDRMNPEGMRDAVNQLARDSVSDARIESLVAELRDRPTFRYFAGGEATYAIAWSDEERRFVTVWSCC